MIEKKLLDAWHDFSGQPLTDELVKIRQAFAEGKGLPATCAEAERFAAFAAGYQAGAIIRHERQAIRYR